MSTDISVIMPMYNIEEEYLSASIGSFLAQTKKDGIELIITDDGSVNGCGAIADEYASRHKNIHVIHTENSGAGPARNTAIKQAKGKYLAFLDADDLLVPDALEKMFDRAEHDHSEIAMINAVRFDSDKESQASIHKITFRDIEGVTNVFESPQLIYDTVSWDKLIRRDFWERNKLEFPLGLYEDIPVMTRAILRAKRFSIIRSIGYKWRIREMESTSITQKRADINNLLGRLASLRNLDSIYAEEITNEAILLEKQIKALKVDLKIYSHACIDMEPQNAERYMQEIGSYIRENISDKAMQSISPVDRAMYEALLEGDRERFVRLADFSKNRSKSCLNAEKDGVMYKIVPEELFGTDLLDNTINSGVRLPRVGVLDVECDKGRIRFKTQLYFTKMDISAPEDQEITAALCDEHTGEETALPVTYFDNHRLTVKRGTVSNKYTSETAEYNYDGTGFYIDLYPKKIGKVENAVIVIRYKNRYTKGVKLLRKMSDETKAKMESVRMKGSGRLCTLSSAEMQTVKVNIEKSLRYYF